MIGQFLFKKGQQVRQQDWNDSNQFDYWLIDHANGFSVNLTNPYLDYLQQSPGADTINLKTEYVFNSVIKKQYPNLRFLIDLEFKQKLFNGLSDYNIHPELEFKNFICSFNGSPHVSRKLLVSALHKFGFFNSTYSSKNFIYDVDTLAGHVQDYAGDQENFYAKFFISTDSQDFFQSRYSFGHMQYEHNKNIYNLEHKLTQSFLHLVSECIATSYYPFHSEKFLYSVVTRGLFLTFGQPNWHEHLEKYYGFKKYNKLFNYHFDSISNPVERLIELMSMISKFSHLKPSEWHDLYLIEQDTIEHNYDHYFSGAYLKHLNCIKNIDNSQYLL